MRLGLRALAERTAYPEGFWRIWRLIALDGTQVNVNEHLAGQMAACARPRAAAVASPSIHYPVALNIRLQSVSSPHIFPIEIKPSASSGKDFMRCPILLASVGSFAVLLTGCFQLNQAFTLNPDGSGKVVYDLVMTAPEDNAIAGMLGMGATGRKPRTAKPGAGFVGPALSREMAKGILEGSKGIETWKDIAIEQTKEGKMHFRGTAYFRDLSTIKFGNAEGAGVSSSEQFTFIKGASGEMTLEMRQESKSKPASARTTMTDQEIEQNLQMSRQMYHGMKPMFATVFSDMKVSYIFNVPGKVSKTSNFKEDSGALKLSIE